MPGRWLMFDVRVVGGYCFIDAVDEDYLDVFADYTMKGHVYCLGFRSAFAWGSRCL